jgi:hypothetical protein
MSLADPVAPERPRRRPILGRFLLILLVSLAVPVLPYLVARWNASRAVQAAAAAIATQDPGWTWEEIQDCRDPVPDDQNGATQVLAAYKLLPPQWMNWHDPAVLARVGLTEIDSPALDNLLSPPQSGRRLDDKYLKVIRAEVERARPALTAALRVTEYRRGRFPIPWRATYFTTLLGEVQNARAVSTLLGYRAQVRAHDGDFGEACACARAMLHVARTLDAEPAVIAYLVRVAQAQAAVDSLQRTLALGQPAAADLVPLASLLEQEDATEPALCLAAMRGERAGVHKMFEAYESGEVPLADLMRLAEMNPRWAGALGLLAVPTVRHAHAAYLRHITAFIEISKLPAAEQPARYREAEQELRADPNAVFARLLVPAADRIAATQLRRQAELRCVVAGLAAERYRQEKDHWPERLTMLVPMYLKAVPADPYDGQPLRLRRLRSGVVIYAVGPDQKDDGGAVNRRNPVSAGTDVGFRLWDVDQRGRPAPR